MRTCARGFTLVELLTVVGIMILLMAMVIPAFNSVGRTSNLTNGANMVVDQLNLARQTALTQNRLVQVRFYKLPGPTDGTNPTAYRAVRLFVYDPTGTVATPVSAVKYLPTGSIIVSGAFSTLLGPSYPFTSLAPTTGTENLPSFNNATYVAFQFRPSGGTSLDPNGVGGDKWFLSFKLENDPVPAGNTRPAINFITALIDPVSGRVRVFRP
jgi:uncharacterized protein (TIGR02596 family)